MLAWEMFDLGPWFAYVAASVLLEAWLIGGALRLGLFKSLGLSVVANALTAAIGGYFAVPLLHRAWVGSVMNPSPFGHL